MRVSKSWRRDERRRSERAGKSLHESARAITESAGEEGDGRRKAWKVGMLVAGERR
jgi:hypothetical protein